MAIQIATLCDRGYLLKGLAMRQSLIDLGVDYRIYWLCLDSDTYRKVHELGDERIIPYLLEAFENTDEELRKAQSNPPSKYGSQRDNYIWALTPYFINYVLSKIDNDQYLMYVDSDIYFYQSPQVILDIVDNRSIGIHTHRFSESAKKRRKNINEVGWYNVGVTVFKKDDEGVKISRLWKEWCLDISNKYYNEFGSCGDQGYLCAFALETDEKNICVFDEEGNISHIAPWCAYFDEVKPVIFFHFSHFQHDVEKDTWSDSIHGEWKPASHKHIKPYYEKYFKVIKQVAKFTQ